MKKKKKPAKPGPKKDDHERDRIIAALIDTGAAVKVIDTAMIDHRQFQHRLR